MCFYPEDKFDPYHLLCWLLIFLHCLVCSTALPIGEYAAVTLLLFFGLKSIKDAWDLPSDVKNGNDGSPELDELAEAEELVKEKVWLLHNIGLFSIKKYICQKFQFLFTYVSNLSTVYLIHFFQPRFLAHWLYSAIFIFLCSLW